MHDARCEDVVGYIPPPMPSHHGELRPPKKLTNEAPIQTIRMNGLWPDM